MVGEQERRRVRRHSTKGSSVTDQEQEPETAEETAEAEVSEPKTPTKRAAKPKAVPEYCDNHPDKRAKVTTTRGGAVRTQRFCVKCAAKLPADYARG
jgi:FKBP-type peptidyl-prolyl cis-trans isomerase